jgi:hypothetical protein
MRDWLAVRGLLALVLVWAVLMAGLQVLVRQEVNEVIIPPPEKVAADMMQALKAHRYEGARNALGEQARAQVSVDVLRSIIQDLETDGFRIVRVEELESQIAGSHATARVAVKLNPPQEKILTFSLVKEKGEWKIDSTDPVTALFNN